MATEEAWRVREPKHQPSWVDKSVSQQRAESEVQAGVVA
jgi:hypothetical protein